MAANQIDRAFELIHELIKEVGLTEEFALNSEEGVTLAKIQEKIGDLWDAYLDRQITEMAEQHPDPDAALARNGIDAAELDVVRERVRTRLIKKGIPLGKTKRTVFH